MAITASGLFADTLYDCLNNSIALDLNGTGITGYLISDSATVSAASYTAADVSYSTYSAYEVSGTNWPASGVLLNAANMTSYSSGYLVFKGDDVSVASTTLTNAMAYVVYDSAAGNRAICLVDFVTALTTSNGLFQIAWAAGVDGGIWYLDMIP